ncbi:MAG: DUF4403 family protein [Gemmatimonadota bacterium]
MRTKEATLLCSLLVACDRGPAVEAPPPGMSADVDSLPALELSLIEAPISYDLTPIIAELEAVVPKRFGDLSERREHPKNKRVRFAFEAERSPFVVELDAGVVRMTATITYAGRAWYNPPIAPEMSASCGTGDQRPRARVEIVSPMRISADWKLRSATTVQRVEPFEPGERDQCEVTVLKIDVTERVIDAARGLLEKNTKAIDAKVATIDLRSKFEEWWSIVQQPIHLSDSVWLAINPKAVQVDPASGSRKLLRTGIGLLAEPRIVIGRRPAIAAVPLPRQVSATEAPDGFHILLEGVLPYDIASKLLTEELRGQKIKKGGHTITVVRTRMFGVGGNKIALEVEFRGSADGRVYFVGTPHYDYGGDRLYVPDLEYDVGSAHMLVRGLEWLKHDDLRDYLRDKARWPVGGLIKQGQEQLVKGLNQELAPGVQLTGEVTRVKIVGVHAARDAVRVRAHADGAVQLDVRPSKK